MARGKGTHLFLLLKLMSALSEEDHCAKRRFSFALVRFLSRLFTAFN